MSQSDSLRSSDKRIPMEVLSGGRIIIMSRLRGEPASCALVNNRKQSVVTGCTQVLLPREEAAAAAASVVSMLGLN
jgi:hypothetical protein